MGFLSREKILGQEKGVRVLQGQTAGLLIIAGVMGILPFAFKLPRSLNFFILGLGSLLSYAAIESAHKLEEMEAPYITAKTFAKQTIANQYAAEAYQMDLTINHEVAKTRQALNPRPQRQIQGQGHPQQQQLAPSQQSQQQPAQGQQPQQVQQLQPVELDYSLAIVEALGEHQAPVLFEKRLEGSAFDRYLLSKAGKGATFTKVSKLGRELQLDLRLEVEPLIDIHEGCFAVDIPRKHRKVFRYEDYIRPGQRPQGTGIWVPIGVSLTGKLIEVDLTDPDSCHILGGGASGSGKSVWLAVAVKSLCDRYTPEEVKIILCDFGKATFGSFENEPHLMCPVQKDLPGIIRVLNLLVREQEQRKELLDEYRVPHLAALNKVLPEPLPYIVNFTDEYAAEIEACTPDERKQIESLMVSLSLEARKTGISLFTFMQRPEEDYLDGQVRSNHPASVCLKVKRAEDSKMVLGAGGLGGEKLLGKGDLLFLCGGVLQRLQSLFWEPAGKTQASSQPQATQVEFDDEDEEEEGSYAYRYPSNWKRISRETKIMTGGICCFPGCKKKAVATHHAQYQRVIDGEMISICDDPEPGVDLFPLCQEHHSDRLNPECAHHKNNWVYGVCQDPLEIDSQNTDDYRRLLERGWLMKTEHFEQFVRARVAQEVAA